MHRVKIERFSLTFELDTFSPRSQSFWQFYCHEDQQQSGKFPLNLPKMSFKIGIKCHQICSEKGAKIWSGPQMSQNLTKMNLKLTQINQKILNTFHCASVGRRIFKVALMCQKHKVCLEFRSTKYPGIVLQKQTKFTPQLIQQKYHAKSVKFFLFIVHF